MKKLLLLAAVCLMGLYACKKSDSDSNAKKIIGKWTIQKAVLIKVVNGADSVEQVDDQLDADTYVQFNKDGSAVSHSGNNEDVKARYTLAGDVLSLTADSLSVNFKVKTLTSNSLVLRQQDDFNDQSVTYYTDTYFTK